MSKFPDALRRSLRGAALAVSLAAASIAWAVPAVTYVATDLPDTTVGQDLWHYDYSLSGPLDAFFTIDLLFPYTTYGPLTSGTSDPSFDVLLSDPDPALAGDGLASFTALNPVAGTTTVHVGLSFVWTGTGAPGAQAFEVLDDGFNVVGGGRTTAVSTSPIPEPASILLLLGGLAVTMPLAARRRRAV